MAPNPLPTYQQFWKEEMKTSDLIHNGDFCSIVSDKFAGELGVKRGHSVYVAGNKALPESDSDPYTQRIKFFVHLVDHDGHIDTTKLYLMDPVSIQKVSKSKQKKLMKIAVQDHPAPKSESNG